MQKILYLVGFMGSGKSYWGRRLAGQLGVPFVDLDELIESAEGMTVAEVFTRRGEATFRRLEQQYLKETAAYAPCVIASGGGTPCFFDNMDWMNTTGMTIYLKMPVDVLVNRLRAERSARPLLQGIHENELPTVVAHWLKRRESFYLKAQALAHYSADQDKFFNELLERIKAVSG